MKIRYGKSGFNINCSKTAKRFQAGFTLIEMLVVIAIIAPLLSIIMPSLEKAGNMAMRVKCANNLRQIHLTMSMYVDSHDDVYPCAQDPDPQPPYGYWLWMGRRNYLFADGRVDYLQVDKSDRPGTCSPMQTLQLTESKASIRYINTIRTDL